MNNGLTFDPVSDHENVFFHWRCSLRASDHNIVWVGMGEANNSRSAYWVDGVYILIDGGQTWKKLTKDLPDGKVGRIGLAVSAKNPKIIYAFIENANKPGMSPKERRQEIG